MLNMKKINEIENIVDNFRKKGNIFVIATGRSYFDLQNKVNLYHFKYDYGDWFKNKYFSRAH